MTAWLGFAMWLTLMPCGCRGGGGVKCAPIGPKRAKKKCVPTTFLKTAVILRVSRAKRSFYSPDFLLF